MSISRREFLKDAALGVAAVGILGAAGQPAFAEAESYMPETAELPIPPVTAPEVTEYTADILVIGSGFTGIPAAVTAKAAGKSVLIVDKGHPGYSGNSPFPQCYQFFDSQYGDDGDFQLENAMRCGEYIANLDWYRVFLEESRACFDEVVEWGVINDYPNASEDPDEDMYADDKAWKYHQKYAAYDRRLAWKRLLAEKDIPYVDHTMLMDVIEQQGRVVGALGLHVQSGALITFHCKAVIMAMGSGSYRNAGFPMSGDTFDHEWIAYQHGIPVTGKEWDHLEATSSLCPSSCWHNYSWGYLENMHPTAGWSINTAEPNIDDNVKARVGSILNRITAATEGIAENSWDLYSPQGRNNSLSADESDPRRTGNNVDPMPKRDIIGASVGMGTFHNNGVFCGLDDLMGFTGLEGLYVAGDSHASMIYGATYSPGQGGSVIIDHIQGKRSAKAAAAYADTVEFEDIDPVKLEALKAEILAPMERETGINPRWARDVLQGIMAPWWVQIVKTEESLTAALASVIQLRDNVVPKLVAWSGHDLRLCHEVKHCVLSAEMKLRANLERRETRGSSYRADYPYRDDENFLCYITLSKGEDGNMEVKRVPVKEEWKGDTGLPYGERYTVRFPGEVEALGLES